MLLAEKIRAGRSSTAIRYIQTKDAKGMHAFYFYQPKPGMESFIERAMKDPGLYDLAEMGQILYSGFGKKPSKRDVQAIEKKLNIRLSELFPHLVN